MYGPHHPSPHPCTPFTLRVSTAALPFFVYMYISALAFLLPSPGYSRRDCLRPFVAHCRCMIILFLSIQIRFPRFLVDTLSTEFLCTSLHYFSRWRATWRSLVCCLYLFSFISADRILVDQSIYIDFWTMGDTKLPCLVISSDSYLLMISSYERLGQFQEKLKLEVQNISYIEIIHLTSYPNNFPTLFWTAPVRIWPPIPPRPILHPPPTTEFAQRCFASRSLLM